MELLTYEKWVAAGFGIDNTIASPNMGYQNFNDGIHARVVGRELDDDEDEYLDELTQPEEKEEE
ncbi:MAG: hypothetical protein MJZ84_08360 [Paludibacteraceae bacterium]|nr:hypothetical protein [Paludibacteraceae bacterium]